MKTVNLIFPHQLHPDSPLLDNGNPVYLVEEYLFFKQYKFHKQKLIFHRASMKAYEDYLKNKKVKVDYLSSTSETSDIRKLIPQLAEDKVKKIFLIDPTDNWLEKRIKNACADVGIELEMHESLLFLNTKADLEEYFGKKKRYFQADFYEQQRKNRGILMEGKKPYGGKWSFDSENRKKYPRKKKPPKVQWPKENKYVAEAKRYVDMHFHENYGFLDNSPHYPMTFRAAEVWFEEFLEERFLEFGPYEDAMVQEENILHHSVLTPLLNVGLLSPQQVLNRAIAYAAKHDVPLNSLEGFVRQIMGWREFIRGVYEWDGSAERTRNFWGFQRKIPKAFWEGKTGVVPIDNTVQKTLKAAYNHHIERLMVLGNFMLLCEFDPDEVYRWFMEMYIDAYDWVMVPNVYGMSQFADGGLMATKPYISGSNYLKKMSDFPKGDWEEIWDALFWRFMHVHRDFLGQNHRLKMLLSTLDRMSKEKREKLLSRAESFLKGFG
ncbi:cryptochrome/photolyase family protein [Echinicola sp. CAU 1574]|uniref:Cryptochrome/photolyase family protein n=1 Tax=Echinicola arenosa TaxID=2774144 RepID=A0ABR9APT0_9BACT|nr:cryptochrome/photolyase family protein [Echinicola arenosa]MBD8489604.1 cryptochrome/photolyase family protein [Echinicola arenosa]